MNILLYSTLNIGLTPSYGIKEEDKEGNHVLKTIQYPSIPIYIIGDLVYRYLEEKKVNLLPNIIIDRFPNIKRTTIEEAVFRVSWQTFFNSLIYVNFKEIIIDDIIVLFTEFIKHIFDKEII